MNEKFTIVKVSGKIVEKADELRTFIKAFAAIKGKKMLIFSGNMMAQEIGNKLGIKTKLINDRPVVDAATLKLLTMVYGGLVSRLFVSLLQGNKVNALGVTGADMNLITSVKIPNSKLGDTGQVRHVNTEAIARLIDNGIVPVLAPITHDGRGNLLFNETDAMAAEIARALALRFDITLIYCFEKKGVLLNPKDPDSAVANLRRTQFKTLRDMEIITDWFDNKVDNAFQAIDHGVKEVIITCPSQMGNPDKGTHIKG
ncbi:MAG: acetylglutamate kinase [Muribaculaceae bacterium]|nr:acetylglutamate kinase [Muribaculaceae bacterium]